MITFISKLSKMNIFVRKTENTKKQEVLDAETIKQLKLQDVMAIFSQK